MDFAGSYVALISPFRDGQVDFDALGALVDRQMEADTDGLVPCGTTGESPTLSPEEQEQIIRTVVKRANGRCKVIAGTGSNCTEKTVAMTRQAAEIGADAAMIVAPYYNKPSQDGLYRHYAEIASKVDLPLMIYNIPGRTGVTIECETIIRLRKEFENIQAVKHATGCVDGASELMCRSDITILSGDDSMTLPLMAVGARGVVSVLANIMPEKTRALTSAMLDGKLNDARRFHLQTFALAKVLLTLAPNPVPVKTALSMMGLCREELRLPLCPMDDTSREHLLELLRTAELVQDGGVPEED